MICKAVIERIEKLDEYQGDLFLEVNKTKYLCYYLTNEIFADSYFCKGNEIDADIRVNCGEIEAVSEKDELFCKMSGNTMELCGKIVERINDTFYYKVDCGKIVIEIEDSNKQKYEIGDKIKYEGSMQVFFPGTEWSFEKIH